MHDHTLHWGIKHNFCCYCLQAFSTEEILKSHINSYFKINGKQMILRFLNKVNVLNSKIINRK